MAASSRTVERGIATLAGQTVGIGVVLGGVLMATGVLPFHSAGFAVAFALGVVMHVDFAGVMHNE